MCRKHGYLDSCHHMLQATCKAKKLVESDVQQLHAPPHLDMVCGRNTDFTLATEHRSVDVSQVLDSPMGERNIELQSLNKCLEPLEIGVQYPGEGFLN